MSEPSNQMQLPGCSMSGEELMREARAWADSHEDEFRWFCAEALRDSRRGYASADYLLQTMRRRYRVKVKNAYAPALARIAIEKDSRITFRLARSKVDGYCNAVLR
ncbi:MAG: hypothetical protein HFJ75_07565 [Eggerthellaceae bacterium]|nr:hypothetical protein [Eggerthellaceae bacterium]